MKISQSNIIEFINNIPSHIKAFLVYGPDGGLVTERVNSIISKFLNKNFQNSLSFFEFNYDKLKDNLEEFISILYSRSLTGEKKVIKIYDVRSSMITTLQEILLKYEGQNIVVFASGDLPPGSTVRKFFENGKSVAAIACYHDEQKTIKNIIIYKLKSYGFSYDNDALLFLESHISGDRVLILNAIEKLITYKGNDKHIKLQDVLESTVDQLSTSLDALCYSVADFNYENTNDILQQLLAENIQVITIIRSLSRYFIRLYQVKCEEEKGIVATEAIKILEPPLFFKNVHIFLQHIKKWTSSMLIQIIEELCILEANSKKTGASVQMMLDGFILKKSSRV
ncbi:DNA polymerase III subunit delta [Rickettsiales bacterium Ac37b]|nr:DNA polymerase III subunit delta [Rickettsiales bacterium Ac37b]